MDSPAPGPRAASSDRAFKIVALVAGACLLGFIVYVVLHERAGQRTGAPVLAPAAPAALSRGSTAPAFTLPALDGGGPVSLAAYRGHPVVVNFFASWCPHCRAELSAFAAAAAAAASDRAAPAGPQVQFVGVDTNDTSASAPRALLAAANATYPVGVDAHAAVATRYLLTALPVTYFIDGRGRVVGAAFGAQTRATLESWVRRLGTPGGVG